jgi:hypothetical protein
MIGYAVNALEVFPCALWVRGSYHMYFASDGTCDVGNARVESRIDKAFFSAYPGRSVPRSDRAVVDVAVLSRADVAGLPVNTDDRPVFEYYFLDDLFGGGRRRLRVYLDSMSLRTRQIPVVATRE